MEKGAGARDFIDVLVKAANPDIFSSYDVLNDLYSSSKAIQTDLLMEFDYQPEGPVSGL